MNTNTSLAYIAHAIDRASEPMHPNFRKALERRIAEAKTAQAKQRATENLKRMQEIREAAARAVDANPGNPRAAVVATLRALRHDVQGYVSFLKDMAGSVAFAAHMDVLTFEKRASVVSEETLDAGVDAMLELHAVDVNDVPVFDVADAAHHAVPRENYEGNDGPEPLASSIEDAYEGVKAAQAWLSLGVSSLDDNQRQYWGVEGLMPLAQRKIETQLGADYQPIIDFDEYRELQNELWKEKQRAVRFSVDAEELMMAN